MVDLAATLARVAAVTWGGVAVLLALTGLSQEQSQAMTDLLAAAAAAASIFLPEQGAPR